MTNTRSIEFNDIQGLVTRGYGNLPAACYLLLGIQNVAKARAWLNKLAKNITYADSRPDKQAINISLSYSGVSKLIDDPAIADTFSDEFRSGMNTIHKRHILGDEGENAPEHWLWGGPATETIDCLLLCYAKDETALNKLTDDLLKNLAEQGLKLIENLTTEFLPDNKEHFGFRDSIGQPFIGEFKPEQAFAMRSVHLGEFLLGYPNGYERYTQSPSVHASKDPNNLLKPSPENTAQHDLGLNGTYLVFRQLFQDVPGFWRSLKGYAEELIQTENPALPEDDVKNEAIRLASKMVGRWPSGTALVHAPDKDLPDIENKDDFTYHATDADGRKCPLGAHIRRTNPRDSLQPEPGTEKSLAFSDRHRLLRRGRPYGKPYDASVDPEKYLQNLDKEAAPVPRGLHFICLNANIGRQFEFVQHTWSNNPNFNGLYKDPDPIIGSRTMNGLSNTQFTIQKQPVRCQLNNLPAFIQTRGGGYFFMPSRRALHFLLS
jgi:Dyp-type peroxidase family